MNSFAIMILFLTRIPLPYSVDYSEDELAKGIKLMPLVGLLIGGLLYGTASILGALEFDRTATAIVVWTVYLIVTGGLHIDGLADTFDGVYSNRDSERVLEIMKDSQIGTFGVLGIIVALGLGVVFSSYLDPVVYLLFPLVGRCASLLVCGTNRYARKEGMGRVFVDRCGNRELSIGLISAIAISGYAMGLSGAIGASVSLAVAYFLAKKVSRVIDGITGDTIGFAIETSQVVFLLGAYTASKIMFV